MRLRPDMGARAADIAAGMLLREKPDGTAIGSFSVYRPGHGGSEDPAVVTLMWELQYELDDADGRDGDWWHVVNGELAEKLRDRLRDPTEA